jgi:hypothetical protein
VGRYLSKEERVLVIGCGNSDFSAEMYARGEYHNIDNVDFRCVARGALVRLTGGGALAVGACG